MFLLFSSLLLCSASAIVLYLFAYPTTPQMHSAWTALWECVWEYTLHIHSKDTDIAIFHAHSHPHPTQRYLHIHAYLLLQYGHTHILHIHRLHTTLLNTLPCTNGALLCCLHHLCITHPQCTVSAVHAIHRDEHWWMHREAIAQHWEHDIHTPPPQWAQLSCVLWATFRHTCMHRDSLWAQHHRSCAHTKHNRLQHQRSLWAHVLHGVCILSFSAVPLHFHHSISSTTKRQDSAQCSLTLYYTPSHLLYSVTRKSSAKLCEFRCYSLK